MISSLEQGHQFLCKARKVGSEGLLNKWPDASTA